MRESTAFESIGPDVPTYVFDAGDHAGRNGDELGEAPFHTGTLIIAKTDDGVVISQLPAEQETDDSSILGRRFDRIVETLAGIN